jgi:hypothetical protein
MRDDFERFAEPSASASEARPSEGSDAPDHPAVSSTVT